MKLWPFRRAATPAPARRAFEASAITRLTNDWLGVSTSIDQELRGQLDRLRRRARELEQNNDYVKRFLSMVARNVVGPSGFTLQSRVEDGPGKPDALAARIIETAWDDWSRPAACDVTGRQSFPELCRQIMRTIARDGEALVHVVRGAAAPNACGLALQVIDPARLDVTCNVADLGGGARIVMGVELNLYGRPVAYHIRDRVAGDVTAAPGPRRRIVADEIFHLFVSERAEQTRGVPWLHTAMVRLHHLKGYDQAAIIAARIGAMRVGAYTMPEPPQDPTGDGVASGAIVQDLEEGQIDYAPPGYDYKAYGTTYPHAQYDTFVRACLRGIASGLDVSYASLANDLENVNFSSIRAGTLDERDHWMSLQGWFIDVFLQPLFDVWLQAALTAGALVTPTGAVLPVAKIAKFRAHQWQGRRWAWVDPLKDIQASVLSVQNHIASPQMIAAQSGRDIEDVLADLAAYHKLLESFGLPPPPAVTAKPILERE